MGKWIAAAVIFVCLVLPVPVLLVLPPDTLSGWATSWLVPKQEAALAQKYIEDVRLRTFDPVINAFELDYITPEMPDQLKRLAGIFPAETPRSAKLVASNTINSNGVTTYTFTYEYEFSRRWFLVAIALNRSGDHLRIHGVHVWPMERSLEQINALSFVGKGPVHYIFAAAAVVVYLFWLVSVYACLFTPIVKRKWLWVIFVLVGFGGLNLNWTNGGISYGFINIAIPAARLWCNFYSPWIVQISLPLGAILFWLRRADLVARTEPDLRSVAVAPAP